MSLSDYKMYPKGSLVQKLPEIGGILFGDMPEPIEKAFHPGGEGGFTYRSAVGFKLVSDFPETESEAVGVWNAFRVRKEKKISAYFGKGVAPVLFPSGLTLRSAEKVPVKHASALPISWDRIEGFYWVLTYDLVLKALRPKYSLASLAATHLLGYESPFQNEELAAELNVFLKKAEKLPFHAVVKGASLKVYVSGKHVIGMDYSLPVMEYGKPSELLKIPDRIQYSGSQSVSEVEDVPDFYFRVQEGLVVPFYMDGVAACKEGVVGEEKGALISEPFNDYYASVDMEKKEIHFFIELFYNKNDQRITGKLGELSNKWPSSVFVQYSEKNDNNIELWTLFFNVKHTPIEAELKSTDPNVYNNEGADIVEAKYPHGLLLTVYDGGAQSGYTSKFVMRIDNDFWIKDYGTYSHELGHVFYNSLDVEDKDIKSDVTKLPLRIKQLIESKLIKTGLQNQGSAQQRNTLNEGINPDSHIDNLNYYLKEGEYSDEEMENWEKPVRFKPDFGNNYQWWPEVEFSKNPTNPQKYGYTGIPMMCYGDDEKKEIWIFEYQELIRQTLLYVEIFMQKVYNQDYKKFSIQKYYIKRRSRIVFWDNIK